MTELHFDLAVVIDRVRPSTVKLKAVAGPDNRGAPCLTIMYADED